MSDLATVAVAETVITPVTAPAAGAVSVTIGAGTTGTVTAMAALAPWPAATEGLVPITEKVVEGTAPAPAGAMTVSVELPPAATAGGLAVQVSPAGSPCVANVTCSPTPLVTEVVTVNCADPPGTVLPLAGESAIEKSLATVATTFSWSDAEAVPPSASVASTVSLWAPPA